MKNVLWTVAVSFALAVPGGCAAEDESQDARDDDFLVDGKSDTGGISEGTPEAAAVLHVVNTSSRAVIGGDVGIAGKAADNIVAVRDGDDGAAGTNRTPPPTSPSSSLLARRADRQAIAPAP